MASERRTGPVAGPDRAARLLLGLAAVAVAFAAADTYVVVLSLPDMMGSVGLSVDELQRAAPIVSGFLLGYVAMLPLIGRIADLRGRTPVLVAALVVFAFGSLVTAAAYDLGSLVAGRFLQGVGGGGLVPVTLALVADLYPADRRGVPLGVVGAVQELGSVLGPLYGAVVLAFGTWRDIFWINLAVGLVLAAAVATLDPPSRIVRDVRPPDRRVDRPNVSDYPLWRRVDWIGLVLLALTLISMLLVMRQPSSLVHLGRPGRAVRAVLRRRVDLVRPSSGWSRSCSALLLRGLAAGRAATAGRPARLVALGARGRPRRRRPCCRSPWAGSSWPSPRPTPRCRCSPRPGSGTSPSPRSPPSCSGCTTAARRLRWCRTARSRERPAWGAIAGQLLRRRGPDRRAGGHPDLRADHRRRRLADQGRAGAGRVPGRAAGRRARWAAYSSGGCRPGCIAAVGMLLAAVGFCADGRLGLRVAAPPVVLGRAGDDRLRLRAGARPGQRGPAGQHRRHGARRHQRAARGGPDGRDAGRHLGPDHDRAAALLRRARSASRRRTACAAATRPGARRTPG